MGEGKKSERGGLIAARSQHEFRLGQLRASDLWRSGNTFIGKAKSPPGTSRRAATAKREKVNERKVEAMPEAAKARGAYARRSKGMEIDVRHWLWTTGVAAIVASGSAFAADLPTYKTPPLAPFTWTGCYVGINAGGDFGRSKWEGAGGVPDLNTYGAIAGGQVGCNYQMNSNFVVGAEGEIWGSGLSGSWGVAGPGGGEVETRSNFAGDLAVRGGYAIDRTLIFGKVGVVMADYRYETIAPGGPTATASATHTGLLLGLGVEYALDAHWSVKGEYDCLGYPTKAAEFYSAGVPFGVISFKNDENIIKAGANYRF
jgi:outer membrane immunogenic protein